MRIFYSILAGSVGFYCITWIITGETNFIAYQGLSIVERVLIMTGSLLSVVFAFILTPRLDAK